MEVLDVLALIITGIIALVGGIYGAVRLAIRAEIAALELRVREKYVSTETCRAIRADCERYHAAAASQTAKPKG